MATTTKKGSKNKRAKLRAPVVKTSAGEQAQTNAGLRQQLAEALEGEKAALKKLQDRDQQLAESANELQDCQRRLTEALEQQNTTGEILRVIASSPTDIQPVLDTVGENAARLCAADDAQILLVEGDVLRRAASFGSHEAAETRPNIRGTAAGRAVIDRETVHVHDIRAAEDQGFLPGRGPAFSIGESRTLLAAPLLREGVAIGTILIRRFEV